VEAVARGASRQRTEDKNEVRQLARTVDDVAAALERQRAARLDLVTHLATRIAPPLEALTRTLESTPPRGPESAAGPAPSAQLERLRRVLDECLDAVRIEEGAIELRRDWLDLNEMVSEAIAVMERLALAHRFVLSRSERALASFADERRLTQVVTNLMFLAARTAPPSSSIQVDVRSERDEDVIEIQVESARSSGFENQFAAGRGLDLATAGVPGASFTIGTDRRIVEAHGGRLELRGMGNDRVGFLVRLPRQPLAERPQQLQ
jgi:two-component system sensor histidine kinase KdpD